jgi:hypothetical protein
MRTTVQWDCFPGAEEPGYSQEDSSGDLFIPLITLLILPGLAAVLFVGSGIGMGLYWGRAAHGWTDEGVCPTRTFGPSLRGFC